MIKFPYAEDYYFSIIIIWTVHLTYETDVNAAQAIQLGNIHSQDKFNAEVDAMPYTGGDTHTGEALQ